MKQLDYNHQSSYHVQILHNDFHREFSTVSFCLHCALNTKNISQLRCQRILTNTSFITRNTILFLWQQYNGIILPRVDLLLRIADVELPLLYITTKRESSRKKTLLGNTQSAEMRKMYVVRHVFEGNTVSHLVITQNLGTVCVSVWSLLLVHNETRRILLGTSHECRYSVQ